MGFAYFSLTKQYVISLMSEKYVLQRNDFFVKKSTGSDVVPEQTPWNRRFSIA